MVQERGVVPHESRGVRPRCIGESVACARRKCLNAVDPRLPTPHTMYSCVLSGSKGRSHVPTSAREGNIIESIRGRGY